MFFSGDEKSSSPVKVKNEPDSPIKMEPAEEVERSRSESPVRVKEEVKEEMKEESMEEDQEEEEAEVKQEPKQEPMSDDDDDEDEKPLVSCKLY